MNDFLQSLRNGQAEKQRTPKTRKNSDTPYQYNNTSRFNSYGGGGGYPNTRNHQMKRPQSQVMPHQMGNQIPAEDANITLLADILDNLSSHVETLVKNQDYMVNIQERTADMLERQAIAIERIVTHLKLSPETDGPTDSPRTDPDAQPAFENHYTTSRELDETLEDNLGNSWDEPVKAPGIAPLVKPAVKKAKKIQPAPRAKKIFTSNHRHRQTCFKKTQKNSVQRGHCTQNRQTKSAGANKREKTIKIADHTRTGSIKPGETDAPGCHHGYHPEHAKRGGHI
jgi:hypothetical protein